MHADATEMLCSIEIKKQNNMVAHDYSDNYHLQCQDPKTRFKKKFFQFKANARVNNVFYIL